MHPELTNSHALSLTIASFELPLTNNLVDVFLKDCCMKRKQLKTIDRM